MPETIHQLTTSELNTLMKAVDVLLANQPLYDPRTYAKLDTLRADLIGEQDERQRIMSESKIPAQERIPYGFTNS
jgi:aspartyl/asparaginyl beta-hydroxylase (cupin superfamily)